MGAQYDSLGNLTGYTNDDGTAWSGAGVSSLDPTSTRPDLQAAGNQAARARMLQLNNDPAYKQFTPEQVAAYMAAGKGQLSYASSISPFEKFGIYNDNVDGSGAQNLWFGPEAGPQHNDTGPEQAQTAWNDMKNGALIASLPFAWMGAAALGAGAAGAGAGGAGAGAEAGAGTLYAGETASGVGTGAGLGGTGGGATGMGAAEGGVLGGSAGSASLTGGAGADTLGGETVFPGESASSGAAGTGASGSSAIPADQTGAFDMYGSNSGAPGGQPGTVFDYQSPASTYLQQAQDYAKQLGITPAAALQMVLKAAGRAAPGALGAIASSQQQDQFKRLADQYAGYGAPYRQRLSDLYADPNSFLKSAEVTAPVQQASDIAAHSLSTGGNPIASGNSLQQLQDYSANQLFGRLGQEKDRLAGFGGLTQYNAAAPGAATNAINSGTNVANSIGAGISNVFNPPQTLAQQMAEFQRLSSGAVR